MRKYYLDNLRYFTIIVIILFHVLFIYSSIPLVGSIGNSNKNQIHDIFQYMVYPWITIVLFIISGISSYHYLQKNDDFLSDRTNKLLVPCTLGPLLYGYISGYFILIISGYFFYIPEINKISFYFFVTIIGIGPLWFNFILWLNSLLLILIRKYEHNKLYNYCINLNFTKILYLGIGLWISAQLLNVPVAIVFRFGIYVYSFLLGYYIFSHESNIKYLESNCFFLLFIAIGFGFFYIYKNFGKDFTSHEVFKSFLSVSFSWFSCLALLGISKKYFNKEYTFTIFMRKKSYGIYLLHYNFISTVGYYLHIYTNWSLICKYIVVGLSSFFGALLLFEIISRIPYIRWLILGIYFKKKKKIS